MRPPILYITLAFAAGLWAGPNAFVVSAVLTGAVLLRRCAPVGSACGVMLVAGALWAGAAAREQATTCAGRWSREPGARSSRAALVRVRDVASAEGGVVEEMCRVVRVAAR